MLSGKHGTGKHLLCVVLLNTYWSLNIVSGFWNSSPPILVLAMTPKEVQQKEGVKCNEYPPCTSVEFKRPWKRGSLPSSQWSGPPFDKWENSLLIQLLKVTIPKATFFALGPERWSYRWHRFLGQITFCKHACWRDQSFVTSDAFPRLPSFINLIKFFFFRKCNTFE